MFYFSILDNLSVLSLLFPSRLLSLLVTFQLSLLLSVLVVVIGMDWIRFCVGIEMSHPVLIGRFDAARDKFKTKNVPEMNSKSFQFHSLPDLLLSISTDTEL